MITMTSTEMAVFMERDIGLRPAGGGIRNGGETRISRRGRRSKADYHTGNGGVTFECFVG
jgi:hypothetical protein